MKATVSANTFTILTCVHAVARAPTPMYKCAKRERTRASERCLPRTLEPAREHIVESEEQDVKRRLCDDGKWNRAAIPLFPGTRGKERG